MQTDMQRDHARTLRKSMTRAEVFLWGRLRGRGLKGLRFNRQVEIGPYIADFVCREHRLIVEVDGSLREEKSAQRYDARRTEFLNSKGYAVVRFLNEEIYGATEDVLERIVLAVGNRSS